MGRGEDIRMDGDLVRGQVKPVMEAASSIPSRGDLTSFAGPCAPVTGMCTTNCEGGGGCEHSSQVFSVYLAQALDTLAVDAQRLKARAEDLVRATRGAVGDLESMDADTAAALRTYLEGLDSTTSAAATHTDAAAATANAYQRRTAGARSPEIA